MTFAQATNRIETAWALLMKRLGDTGVWSLITKLLDGLGQSSGLLAGAIGVGLAAAIQKVVAVTVNWGIVAVASVRGLASQATATEVLTRAIGFNTGATELAAKAAAEKAAADAAAAGIALRNAEASAAAARATLASATLAASATNAGVAAQERLTAATIRNQLAAEAFTSAQAKQVVANEVLEASNKKLIASQGILARSWAVLTGPAGMIALMVAGFAAMFFAFREQDEATKNLSKSTDEYASSLEKMTAAQIAQGNVAAQDQINDKKELISVLQEELAYMDGLSSSVNSLSATWDGLINTLQFWKSDTEKRTEASRELEKATSELTILEGKRQIGLDRLSNKYIELSNSEESLKKTNEGLLSDQEKQKQVVNSLNDIWFKSSDQVKQLAKEQEKLNVINKELLISGTNLNTANKLTKEALTAYAEQTGLTTEEVKKAIAGDTDFISSLDKKKQATVSSIQRQRELSVLERESQIQLKLLKAEYDNIEGSIKAQTEAKVKEAAVLGDLEGKRTAEIDQARQLVQLAELGIKTSKEELKNIDLQIAQKEEQAKTNEKERASIEKNIGKLEEQRIGLEKTLNQREANIAAVKAEAIATEVANSLISESFTQNKQIIADAADSINSLREEYKSLSVTSESVFNKKQADILDQIKIKQDEAATAARTMGEAMRSVYATLGIDWQETITGMDFDTKRMIDVFGLLGLSGKTTAQQLQTSFEGVLAKANTEAEINAIIEQLIRLKNEGVLSFEQLGLMTSDVKKKLTELKMSVDPVQQAFARLGLGVPEQLKQVADSLQVSFDILKKGNAPIESVQQAFLNMAQAQIAASIATGKAVPESLKLEAASLGLSAALQELMRSLQSTNQEFNAIITQYERLREVQEKNNELKQKEIELSDEWNAVTLKRSQNLGDEVEILASLVKADQLRVESIQQEIAASEKKVLTQTLEIQQLEGLEAAGQKLSDTQKTQLELMKLQLEADQQIVLSGKAKQAQIEAEILSYQNSVNKIQERLKQYELEASLRNEANANQQKTIEIEKQLAISRGDLTVAREKDLGVAKEELEIAKEQFLEDAKRLNAINDEILSLEQKYEREGRNNEQLLKSIETLKLRRDAEIEGTKASEADIKVKERQVELARIAAGPVGALIQLYKDQAQEHERSAANSERYQDALVKEAEGVLNLAKILGDALEIAKAEQEVTQARINQAENLALLRAQEAADSERALSAKIIEMAADREWTQADKEMEAQLRATVDAKKDAANAAQQNAEQIRAEADAAQEAADAQKKLAEEAAKAAEAAVQLAAAGDAVNSNWDAANQVLAETGGNAEELQKAFIRLQEEFTRTGNALSADRFVQWAAGTAEAADQVVQTFKNQKSAVDNAVKALDQFSETGKFTTQTQQALQLATQDSKKAFNLLNDSDLDNLQSALEAANNQLREMQDEANAARERLQELDAEIAAESGDTARADRLKLELDRTRDLADAERALQSAKAQGNKEAVSAYTAQVDKLNQLYALKERNLNQEQKGDKTSTENALNQVKQIKNAWDDVGQSIKGASNVLSGVIEKSTVLNKSFADLRGRI